MMFVLYLLSCMVPASVQSETPTVNPCTSPALAFGAGEPWTYGTAIKVYSVGNKREMADAVQVEAMADLKSKVCTQTLTESECNSLLSNRFPGRNTPYFDEDRRQVCAVVGIPQTVLQHQTPERVRVEAEIDKAIQNLRAKIAEGAQVEVLPVQTLEGCAVPELDVLSQRVRAGLNGISLVPGGNSQVAILVSMQGPQLTVSFELRAGAVTTASYQASFPGALYRLDALSSVCRENALLGLSGGQRAGEVRLSLLTDLVDSGVCSGESFNISAVTSVPVTVHLFSVAPDGQAWHVWPESGEGEVNGMQLLTPATVAPLLGGDESLVAVALPKGSSIWKDWAGFCKLKDPFTDKLYPRGSAVSRITWHIESQDCPPVVDPMLSPENIAATLQAAPLCP